MAENTKIEWADHTFNPWIGCSKVGPGCDHCYAEAWDRRFALSGHDMHWGAGKPRKLTADSIWAQPLRWNREAERLGVRYRVFCASLADVFDNEVPPEWRAKLLQLIDLTPYIDWLLLTKRIGNVNAMLDVAEAMVCGSEWTNYVPRKNVWIGATIVNQTEADRDISKLLSVPAAKRFLSMEPLLGPVGLRLMQSAPLWYGDGTGSVERSATGRGLHWVICGGESGPHARPMHPDWARSLRDQCQAAGVPFLFKQWGEWAPDWDGAMTCSGCGRTKADAACTKPGTRGREEECGVCASVSWDEADRPLDSMRRVGKKAAGRQLDGREWNEVPT